MNKRNTILLVLMLITFNSIAQFKENKDRFDLKSYQYRKGDPYNPLLCGVLSYFMPGLGQMVAGEYERGMGFTGGYIASTVSVVAGMAMFTGYSSSNRGLATSFLVGGMAANLGITIWSVLDAVKCAKVNNLLYREQTGKAYYMKISPYNELINVSCNANVIGLKASIEW